MADINQFFQARHNEHAAQPCFNCGNPLAIKRVRLRSILRSGKNVNRLQITLYCKCVDCGEILAINMFEEPCKESYEEDQ
jgi:hypothetical protein